MKFHDKTFPEILNAELFSELFCDTNVRFKGITFSTNACVVERAVKFNKTLYSKMSPIVIADRLFATSELLIETSISGLEITIDKLVEFT